jgi:hypothetical protein
MALIGSTSTTKSDVGLGSVDNESKSTMFSSPTFTGTIYAYSGGGIRQSEGTDGSDYGHFARRQSWVNSSNQIICQWAMGIHQMVNFQVHFSWTDWCCHSGGGGMLTGSGSSGYGSPGTLSEYNMYYDSHTFNLNLSGYTVQLRCSGGSSNGPGNVYVGCSTTRSDVFSWGS